MMSRSPRGWALAQYMRHLSCQACQLIGQWHLCHKQSSKSGAGPCLPCECLIRMQHSMVPGGGSAR